MIKLKKIIEKLPYSARLANKIHDSGHKTKITPYKTIKTNYKIQYSINPMFEYEIEKKKSSKILRIKVLAFHHSLLE